MRYLIFFLFSILGFGQQTTKVDFTCCSAFLLPNFETKSIIGNVNYSFNVIKDIDTIRIDAKNMVIDYVAINEKPIKYKYTNTELLLFEGFKKGKNVLTLSYTATPKQTLYFIGKDDNLQLWTQGQGKYTSHWLPSFDDVNEKIIFSITVGIEPNYNVVSNGILTKIALANKKHLWKYQMQKPMSSYLVMLAIGKFEKQKQFSNSKIPLEFYLDKKDFSKFETTFRYSKRVFDFLESQIGVKYPWQIYRQVPVRDFLYAGMENTTSTIFAQDFVVNSIGFNDRNYVNVNAHELAHQWFGDMITSKSGKHHWLQEGFATYYALLAEKNIFGEDYFYNQMYINSLQLQNAAKTDTIPVMNEKASSLSFYQKGAWALFVLENKIGAKNLKKAVKNYLKKYKFKNVETDDFLNEIKKVSDFDTENFKKTWLEEYHFQTEEVNQLLNKNKFIEQLFDIQNFRNKPFAEKQDYFIKKMQSDAYFPVKVEIINQVANISFEEKSKLIRAALQTKNIEVRQAVAQTVSKISLGFQQEYETFLDDKSYNTREIALFNLFSSFPEKQNLYLEKAKNWVGNNDKSLRILYLFLSQKAIHFDENLKPKKLEELIHYTSPDFESSIRQNAFDAVLNLNSSNEIVLKNLANATTHFKWQFAKYAKEKIKVLIKNPETRSIFEQILPNLTENQQFQLIRLLK